ncbi:PIN-like domain-containing protein [Mesorhizobium sp.]|uniref:PIN-like domain-containing protein n=1 Tax=Mesorhizobium sp. TaxID=1871066 RepID=UPI00121110C2|nr:PIN-like domain-containing protein [Mesorhizobium sp.]TIQ46740.1 MAG: hypothetical protein E5X47_23385 [Mesorhizobium sp.]TIQ56513.1 MAG: hypothetical protein E5X46_18750 [Mesorhizobium sp.]
MHKTFRGYYQPTAKEFEKLWSEGLLVPDNNVLMHLFRFMPKQRQEVLAAFKSFGDRLWLPYQVAKEFQDGWRSADSSNRGAYNKLKEELARKKDQIDDLVRGFNRFDPWPEGSPMNRIAEFFDSLSGDVDAAIANLPDADEVFVAVSDLFDGKVAPPPEQKDIDARVKEAERRMQGKVPPGYMDKRPGDYLIWAELKEKAKATNLPILFVTDDRKEDWWLEQSGKTIGPRPELRQEFFADTDQLFYAYAPARFLSLLRDRTNNLVSQETVQEMERAESDPSSTETFDRIVRLAKETEVDPVSIQLIAQRIAEAQARIELKRIPDGAGGYAVDWARQQILRWLEQAKQIMFNGEVKPEIVATSSEWAEFLRVVDDLTDEERLRLARPRVPKRARF